MKTELQMVQNCSRPEKTSSSVPASWREVSCEASSRRSRHSCPLVPVHGILLLVLRLAQSSPHISVESGVRTLVWKVVPAPTLVVN